jgi:hypothetical protein
MEFRMDVNFSVSKSDEEERNPWYEIAGKAVVPQTGMAADGVWGTPCGTK